MSLSMYEVAEKVTALGARPILLKPFSKQPIQEQPIDPDWTQPIKDPEKAKTLLSYFDEYNGNIGVSLGAGLVDIDLDCDEARTIFPRFAAPTPLQFGRASYGNSSHYIYKLQAPGAKQTFPDPVTGEMILELRTGSHQTCFPPSLLYKKDTKDFEQTPANLSSHDRILFYSDGTPTKVNYNTIKSACAKAASAILLSRYWVGAGTRQEAIMALAGGLAREGWDHKDTQLFCKSLLDLTGDPEVRMRMRAVKDTLDAVDSGQKEITGFKTLRGLIDEKPINTVLGWLGIGLGQSEVEGGPIQETSDGYIFVSVAMNGKPKAQRLSNFIIKPTRYVEIENEGRMMEVNIVTTAGKATVHLSADDFLSVSAFKKRIALANLGGLTEFFGKDVQLSYLHAFLYQQYPDLPVQIGIKYEGIVERRFICKEKTYFSPTMDMVGAEVKKEVVFVGHESMGCTFFNVDEVSIYDKSIEVFKKIHKYNAPSVALPQLGWIAATFFKRHLIKINGSFPILFNEGEAGSGKSETMLRILTQIWSVPADPVSADRFTNFTQLKMLSSSNVIPVFIEEYKPAKLGQKSVKLISQMLREAYNETSGVRGRRDQSIIHYKMINPIAMNGESGFDEPAINERIVPVYFSKVLSRAFKSHFDFVTKDTEILKFLGLKLLDLALETTQEQAAEIFKEELELTSKQLTDRKKTNATACRFGLKMLSLITGVDYDYTAIDKIFLNLSDLDEHGNPMEEAACERILDTFLKISASEGAEIKTYTYDTHLIRGVHYDVSGCQLKIWLSGTWDVFMKFVKQYGFEGDLLTQKSFKKQIMEKSSFYMEKSASVGKKSRRCLIFDLTKMDHFENICCIDIEPNLSGKAPRLAIDDLV
jgi:hypothetical protein